MINLKFILYNNSYQNSFNIHMDKTFNFFKTKGKKQNVRPRNNSKSNSSKGSYSRNSDKMKITLAKPQPISKKQKEIREAIQIRYQKSKIRAYRFQKNNQLYRRETNSSHSSQMQQYRHLKKMSVVDLKQFHKRQESMVNSSHSSQQRKKFNLRFKIKQNNSNTIIRTQGNQSLQKNSYHQKQPKNPLTSKIQKKTQEWKFISIQIKPDLSKPNNRKNDMKISSHRSYNMQPQKSIKIKPNSSMNKYLDKMGRMKQQSKINKVKL